MLHVLLFFCSVKCFAPAPRVIGPRGAAAVAGARFGPPNWAPPRGAGSYNNYLLVAQVIKYDNLRFSRSVSSGERSLAHAWHPLGRSTHPIPRPDPCREPSAKGVCQSSPAGPRAQHVARGHGSAKPYAFYGLVKPEVHKSTIFFERVAGRLVPRPSGGRRTRS